MGLDAHHRTLLACHACNRRPLRLLVARAHMRSTRLACIPNPPRPHPSMPSRPLLTHDRQLQAPQRLLLAQDHRLRVAAAPMLRQSGADDRLVRGEHGVVEVHLRDAIGTATVRGACINAGVTNALGGRERAKQRSHASSPPGASTARTRSPCLGVSLPSPGSTVAFSTAPASNSSSSLRALR